MAFTNQGGDAIASIFSAIGNDQAPDIQHKALSPEGDSAYSKLFADYNKLLGSQTAGLQDFSSAYKSLTPQLAGLDQLHASTYGNLINQAQNYDPTRNLQSSGNYLFGNLDKYLNTGLKAGTSAMNQALAAGGYGDRGPGGYSALLNANRITGNLLPAFNNIVSNLTPLTNLQNSAYFQNLANIPGFMQGQTNALQATPFRNLVPSQIQEAQLKGNLGTVNDLTKAQLANWYFWNQPNWMQMVGDVGAGINAGVNNSLDTINHAASTYANVLGAGSMGGLGGQRPQQQPDLSGGDNRNTGYFPGESLANMGVSQINTSGYPVGGQYGPIGVGGYSQYNPASALGGYQPLVANPGAYQMPSVYGGQIPGPNYGSYSPYGFYGSQNPYGQYGAFFQ
jgi:hypothetical protein